VALKSLIHYGARELSFFSSLTQGTIYGEIEDYWLAV